MVFFISEVSNLLFFVYQLRKNMLWMLIFDQCMKCKKQNIKLSPVSDLRPSMSWFDPEVRELCLFFKKKY